MTTILCTNCWAWVVKSINRFDSQEQATNIHTPKISWGVVFRFSHLFTICVIAFGAHTNPNY